MSSSGTKQKLLSLIVDFEIISKELLDVISSKGQRHSSIDTGQLVELLVSKDEELQETIKTAIRQVEVHKNTEEIKAKIAQRDYEIRQLQNSLREAESLLSVAIYEGKQKLAVAKRARHNKLPVDDVIKYAHKISASHSVVAPPNWVQGDPRRPFPTENDMRNGWLGKIRELPANLIQTRGLSEALATRAPSNSQTGVSSWPTPVESTLTPSVPTRGKEPDDVEIMSSESSSSSSSED
ncbi:DgyrCDS7885 [Dimorphilus gyrociliatus]|uniref:Mediator of RNA polymerase II transcription subunit 4 n=1 Tax=Dimorphilus gyrociliatus TaxID=2664684 RepID=A0A7I8VUP1_9ANNE|nr:DgyrCDS7885 [Dimorphilus gyrociliatus]